MISQYQRQEGIVTPEELDRTILIIGAGGVGSWLTLALAKMGCSQLAVIDYDEVEVENTASQLYSMKDIGKKKVEALKGIVKKLTGVSISTSTKRWGKENKPVDEIVISAVDDIDVRKEIWKEIKNNSAADYFIDSRMAGELMRIYAVDLMKLKTDGVMYEKTLVPKKDIEQESCTARAVAYNVFIIAGLIGTLVKKMCKGEKFPFEITFDLVNLEFMVLEGGENETNC